MADHFLKLICDNPSDIGPRLVYADWLDEQGDPRGEFIRLQCALEELDENNPRHKELRVRAMKLESQHREQWLGQLNQILGPPEARQAIRVRSSWFSRLLPSPVARLVNDGASFMFPNWTVAFRRGLPESLIIESSLFVEHASAIVDEMPLVELEIINSQQPPAWSKFDPAIMSRVVKLALPNEVTPAVFAQLGCNDQLKALTSLSVWTPALAPNARNFVDSPTGQQLKEITISGDGWMRTVDFVDQLPDLNSLNSLSLIGTIGGIETFTVLMASSLPSRLRSLLLHSAFLDNAIGLHLEAHRFPLLRFLELDANELGDPFAQSLSSNVLLRQLADLSLRFNRITGDGALALADSPHLVGPTKIALEHNPIPNDIRRTLKTRLGDRIQI